MELLIIACLLTWRLSSLLVSERGIADVFGKLRDAVGVGYDEKSTPIASNELAELFLCVWCMSLWIGWGVALLFGQTNWFLMGFVYSAGALIVERLVRS